MAKEKKRAKMEISIKESSCMAKNLEMEFIAFQMEKYIQDNFTITKVTDMVK